MRWCLCRSGMTCRTFVVSAILAVTCAFAAPVSAEGPVPEVKKPVRFAVSPPLRSLEPVPVRAPRAEDLRPELELPPWINTPPEGSQTRAAEPLPFVHQTTAGERAMPATIANFAGLGRDYPGSIGGDPPDTTGDVGPTYYIQWVNTSFAIFRKSDGGVEYGPAAGNTLWQSLGGECAQDNSGDPIVQYDQMAGRWVMTQFAVRQSVDSNFHQCIAVSQTSDPTGSWYLYDYSFSNFNDYPKMGVWPDGYYISYNMFSSSLSWVGGEICAYDRSAMLAGSSSAATQCFGPFSSYGAFLPSDLDGPDLPPDGSPNYVLALGNNGSSLLFWKLHIDWTTPGNSSFTGPSTITVPSFSSACGGGACIAQPGTTNQLDTVADRLMYRLAYRNFGDHESLVVNHSVSGSTAASAVRWYELRNPAGTPSVYQSGSYEPDGDSRWMGSVAMDHVGNLAVGYSVSSSSTYPSIRYAGRLAGDPVGVLSQGEAEIVAGTGYQTGDSRWGDYSTMSVDPTDDCTFWYTQEYMAANGQYSWSTRVASFKFPDCVLCATEAPASLTATPNGDNTIDLGWSAVSGATEYRVYRSETSGGPYAQIATVTAPSTSYADTSVSGSVTYYYVVTAVNGCESQYSPEASATATGPCTAAPLFDGLVSVSTPQNSTCTLDLSWNPASSRCGNSVTYSVYRSTTSGFTPSSSNRIASGVTGAGYSDAVLLASGTPYYYVVRAVDEGNGSEETNTVERMGVPWGPDVDGTWTAGAEDGDPALDMDAPWSLSTANAHSGAAAYASGHTDNACTALTSPDIALTAGQVPSLSFWTAWDIENQWDGGVLELSTNGGSSWTQLTPSGGYPGSFGNSSNDGCGYPDGTGSFTGTQTAYQQYTADLSGYAGQTILLRWRYSTDEYVGGTGWYVDDIAVGHAQVPGSCTTGGTGPCGVPGDADDSGQRTAEDLLALLGQLFGGTPAACPDVDGSAGLTAADLAAWLGL